MIQFILCVNKLGQTRLARYFMDTNINEKRTLEAELVRKCLSRNDKKCSFIIYRNMKIIYRKYVSLYFIIGIDSDDNDEYVIYTFIHNIVQTLNSYFEKVCELDIIMNIEKTYAIIDELVNNGYIMEIKKKNILEPIFLLDKCK